MSNKINQNNVYLGSRRKKLSNCDELEEIMSRIRFCSCILVDSYKDFETLYGFNKHSLRALFKRKSPKIIQIINLCKALNIKLQTNLSPYLNINLTSDQLDTVYIQNKEKINNILLSKIKLSSKKHFIYLNQINEQLITEFLETPTKSKEKIDSILKLFELFNIKLIFPNI